MGGFYQDNKTAVDQEALAIVASSGVTAARGEAISTSGTGNASAKDFGVAQSAGAGAVQNSGALAVGGQNNNFTGATVTAGYDAAAFNNALQSVGNNLSSAVNAQAATSAGNLNAVLSKLSDLAENKQTDGESGRNNTILWIVLGALAVVGIYFFKR